MDNQSPNQNDPAESKKSGFLSQVSGLWSKNKTPAQPPVEKRNALTKILEESKKQTDLVSNIIKQSGQQPVKSEAVSEIGKVLLRRSEAELFWGKVCSALALAVLAVSALTQWVWLDETNPVLGAFGVENLTVAKERSAREEASAQRKVDAAQTALDSLLKQDSNDYALKSVNVLQDRVMWTKVIDQLQEVLARVSPYNPVTHKVRLEQYTFDRKKGEITLSATLQNEAVDRIYSLAANTVDALEESPYFQDVEYRGYSATEKDLGSYSSPLTLLFNLQTADNPRDNANYYATDYSKRRYRNSGFQFSKVMEANDSATEENSENSLFVGTTESASAASTTTSNQ